MPTLLEITAQNAQPPSSQGDNASQTQASSSSSQPRFISTNAFPRSSDSFTDGAVLHRLASSSSTRSHAAVESGAEPRERRPSIGRRLPSRTSRKSTEATTGANLAELSKPNRKFKSGIKWDSQQPPEPFMDVSDTTAAERELASTLDIHTALTSGSTAAAQAHLQNRGIGQPIFNTRPSSSSTSPSSTSPTQPIFRLPTVSQTISALGNSGVHPDILAGTSLCAKQQRSSSTSDAGADSKQALEHDAGTMSGDGSTPCTTPPTKSRQASQAEQGTLTGDNHMVARAAQLVLEAARQQARVETRKKGKSAPASPKRIGASLSPITTNNQESRSAEVAGAHGEQADAELSRTPSQRARSKSDAGEETQAKERKSFLRAMGSRSRRNKPEASQSSQDVSEMPTPAPNSPTNAFSASPGTATPARRRRYADTRDLDLLARELAAEAIAEQVPQPPFARASRSGSSSPHRTKAGPGGFNDPRRRSFPSILEDAPLQDDSITPAPSVSSGLKPMTPLHPSRPNARARAADARSPTSIGGAKALPGSSSDPAIGLIPKEMFLGLGGSPYPSLAPPSSRSASMTLDNMDPFGIPLTQESSPFDATMAYANKTNVYHTPNQVAASRSHSGASTWSTSHTLPNSKRRPVLTMTMNDPQAELQGLTKPPKEAGSKRLTSFGSRASSRGPSPSPSFTNLKQVAAAQNEATDQRSLAENGLVQTDATIHGAGSKELASDTTKESNLCPESASIDDASRRNSIALSELSVRPGLAPAKSSKKNRLSTLFRSNRSKVQVDTVSSVGAASANALSPASSDVSVYNTPSAATPTAIFSPKSAAASADSDTDASPIAFRNVDLPPTQDAPRRSQPTSANASRRSSIALESVEKPVPKKRPIRALLRRLSSFSSKNDKEANSAKANFPNTASMPVLDVDKMKQLSEATDVKTDGSLGLSASADSIVTRVIVASSASTAADAVVESGLAPRIQGLDLSNASPAPVNEEMAKNGFGTRSAYKLGGNSSTDLKAGAAQQKDAVGSSEVESAASSTSDEAKEQDKDFGREDGWERTRPAQIVRSDSQTPSSEDSFFLGSGHSTMSRPGSGALMKHGSESAISEELHTPDPSTTHLPTTKVDEVLLDDDALSSTVSSVTAAAVAAKAMASGDNNTPVVTAVPTDEVQRLAV